MASPNLPHSILVVGSGGREHALVTALRKSPSKPSIICCPGNAGIERDVPCFNVAADDIPGLLTLIKEKKIDFVVAATRRQFRDNVYQRKEHRDDNEADDETETDDHDRLDSGRQ